MSEESTISSSIFCLLNKDTLYETTYSGESIDTSPITEYELNCIKDTLSEIRSTTRQLTDEDIVIKYEVEKCQNKPSYFWGRGSPECLKNELYVDLVSIPEWYKPLPNMKWLCIQSGSTKSVIRVLSELENVEHLIMHKYVKEVSDVSFSVDTLECSLQIAENFFYCFPKAKVRILNLCCSITGVSLEMLSKMKAKCSYLIITLNRLARYSYTLEDFENIVDFANEVRSTSEVYDSLVEDMRCRIQHIIDESDEHSGENSASIFYRNGELNCDLVYDLRNLNTSNIKTYSIINNTDVLRLNFRSSNRAKSARTVI